LPVTDIDKVEGCAGDEPDNTHPLEAMSRLPILGEPENVSTAPPFTATSKIPVIDQLVFVPACPPLSTATRPVF
jgi:hypothetical protein